MLILSFRKKAVSFPTNCPTFLSSELLGFCWEPVEATSSVILYWQEWPCDCQREYISFLCDCTCESPASWDTRQTICDGRKGEQLSEKVTALLLLAIFSPSWTKTMQQQEPHTILSWELPRLLLQTLTKLLLCFLLDYKLLLCSPE